MPVLAIEWQPMMLWVIGLLGTINLGFLFYVGRMVIDLQTRVAVISSNLFTSHDAQALRDRLSAQESMTMRLVASEVRASADHDKIQALISELGSIKARLPDYGPIK